MQAMDYSGSVTISNPGSDVLVVDSITVELMQRIGAQSHTVAAIRAMCGDSQPSEAEPLRVPSNSSTECTYVIRASVGGNLLATLSSANLSQPLISETRPVTAATSTASEGDCAALTLGLGVSAAVRDGIVQRELWAAPLVTYVSRKVSSGSRLSL